MRRLVRILFCIVITGSGCGAFASIPYRCMEIPDRVHSTIQTQGIVTSVSGRVFVQRTASKSALVYQSYQSGRFFSVVNQAPTGTATGLGKVLFYNGCAYIYLR